MGPLAWLPPALAAGPAVAAVAGARTLPARTTRPRRGAATPPVRSRLPAIIRPPFSTPATSDVAPIEEACHPCAKRWHSRRLEAWPQAATGGRRAEPSWRKQRPAGGRGGWLTPGLA